MKTKELDRGEFSIQEGQYTEVSLGFGRKGEDPWRLEQARVADEPERRVWARKIEDGGDVVMEIIFNAVLLDKVAADKQEKLKNRIVKLKEKLVQMKNEETR